MGEKLRVRQNTFNVHPHRFGIKRDSVVERRLSKAERVVSAVLACDPTLRQPWLDGPRWVQFDQPFINVLDDRQTRRVDGIRWVEGERHCTQRDA
jgi:hypothetical protein